MRAATGIIMKGDKIFAINGAVVNDAVQATDLAKAAVGDVNYSIMRGSEFINATVRKPEATTKLGVSVADIGEMVTVKYDINGAKIG